jgi:hypothetical protein
MLAAQSAQKWSQLEILGWLDLNCWYDGLCIGIGATARRVVHRREERMDDLHGEDGGHDDVVCEVEVEFDECGGYC